MAQLAHHPCLVAKGVHIEGGDEVFVSVCLEAPGHRRSGGETEVAYRQVLRVVIVAQSVLSNPIAPCLSPFSVAFRTLPRQLSVRPAIVFHEEVPGHTKKGMPDRANSAPCSSNGWSAS